MSGSRSGGLRFRGLGFRVRSGHKATVRSPEQGLVLCLGFRVSSLSERRSLDVAEDEGFRVTEQAKVWMAVQEVRV